MGFYTYLVPDRWRALGTAPLAWAGAGAAGVVATALLAVGASSGFVAVPVAIQQVLDRRPPATEATDGAVVVTVVTLAALVLMVSALSAYVLTVRLVRRTEVMLDDVRVGAFQHLAEEVRDAPTRSFAARRLLDDIERASQFIRWGGPALLTNVGQVALALVVMLLFSWQLTAVAAMVLVPLVALRRLYRRSLHSGLFAVRRRSLEVRAAITELVMRSYKAHADEERRQVQARAEVAAGLALVWCWWWASRSALRARSRSGSSPPSCSS